MNKSIFLLSTVSYVIITMIIAYSWNVILFQDLYEALGANTRPEPNIPLGLTAIILQGLVISYIYPFFYQAGPHPIVQGIKFNLMMGAMIFSVLGFGLAAKYNIHPITPFLWYTLFFQIFQSVFTGIALGKIYGRMEEHQTSAQ